MELCHLDTIIPTVPDAELRIQDLADASINITYVDIKPTDIIEFSNGNEAAVFLPRNIHLASLCNIVVKVLNSSK